MNAEVTTTRCDQCQEEATYFWPKLRFPVQLCDRCAHDALRSGWQPGIS